MGPRQSKESKRDILQLQKEIIKMNKKSNVTSNELDDYLGVHSATLQKLNQTLYFALSKHTSGDYYMVLLNEEPSSIEIGEKLLINVNSKSYYADDKEMSVTLFIINNVLTVEIPAMQLKVTTSKNLDLTKSNMTRINTFVNSEVYLTAPQLQVLFKNYKPPQDLHQIQPHPIAVGEPHPIAVGEPHPIAEEELESLDSYVGPILVNDERVNYIIRSTVDPTKFFLINADINDEPHIIQTEFGAYTVYDPNGSSVLPYILFVPKSGMIVVTVLASGDFALGRIDNEYAQTTDYTNYIAQYRAKWNV
jgi:hypothetical protein